MLVDTPLDIIQKTVHSIIINDSGKSAPVIIYQTDTFDYNIIGIPGSIIIF